MSIFEGELEPGSIPGGLGTSSGIGSVTADPATSTGATDPDTGAPRDPRLNRFRRGIAAVLGEDGTRIGTLVADVQVWWDNEGVIRKRMVDAREYVVLQLMLDPTWDEDGAPHVLPWVDQWLEPDDPLVDGMLADVLHYPEGDYALRWFEGADAVAEHAENDELVDLYTVRERAE